MKKKLYVSFAIAATALVLAGCDEAGTADEGLDGMIDVIGYDDDSSWRNDVVADYIEIESSDIALDQEVADVQAMIDAVAANPEAIGSIELEGYLSYGLTGTDGVALVTVDSVAPTVATVQDGSYPHHLNLYLVWDLPQSAFAQDFVEFVTSDIGQAVLDNAFIPIASPGSYTAATGLGTGFSLGGSSTVGGVANQLIEAYEGTDGQNSTTIIDGDYDSVGSSAGADGVGDGTYDVGGMSRDLRADDPVEVNLENKLIGYTAWAFLVHPDAPVSSLTTAQLADIFTGTITSWDELN